MNKYKSAEDFNDQFPVGTKAVYKDVFGKIHDTVIEGAAYDMCGSIVAMIEGVRGCYDTDRISAR